MARPPVPTVKSAAPAPARRPLTSAEIRAKYTKVVAVPKPPKRAYNPNRPVSGLIENQIRHLQAAEWKLQPEHRSRVAAQTITTERQASAYIRHVTSRLHPQGAPVAASAPARPKGGKARATKRQRRRGRKARRTSSRRQK